MDIDHLISRGAELRSAMDTLRKELEAVNGEIASLAEFPEGRSTAYVTGREWRARVVRRVKETWDQGRLDKARAELGDELFLSLFRAEWTPVSRREVQGFLGYAPEGQRRHIREALSARTFPYVTCERLGESA